MKIEIQTIGGNEYHIVITELINKEDNWHSITRVTTSPLLPNIERVAYWLLKWAKLMEAG